MSNILIEVEKLVTPIVQELKLELIDLEFVKEGRNWFLRIYVETTQDGIDNEQCSIVNKHVNEVLDANDPIEQNYFLEVSSPGAERPLKKESDYLRAIGQFVFVKTYEPVNGLKEFEGILTAYSEQGLEIEYRVKTRKIKVQLAHEKIALARLAINFSA